MITGYALLSLPALAMSAGGDGLSGVTDGPKGGKSVLSLATTVDPPKLHRFDGEAVCVFLRAYKQYVKEVEERVGQIGGSVVGNVTAKPASLKFCIDSGYFESTIALGFIEGVVSEKDVTDDVLMTFFRREVSGIQGNSNHGSSRWHRSAETSNGSEGQVCHIEDAGAFHFVPCHPAGQRVGVGTRVELESGRPARAGCHQARIAAVETDRQSRLRSPWSEKDFKGFMTHAIKIAEAFQIVDYGRYKSTAKTKQEYKGKSRGSGSSPATTQDSPSIKKEYIPICLYKECREPSPPRKHFLRECTYCPEKDKGGIMAQFKADRAREGPVRNTRAQKPKVEKKEVADAVMRRVENNSDAHDSFFTAQDGMASISATGRCHDGADDNIVSASCAERGAIQGIGKLEKIETVELRVALKKGEVAESFSFSRTWP